MTSENQGVLVFGVLRFFNEIQFSPWVFGCFAGKLGARSVFFISVKKPYLHYTVCTLMCTPVYPLEPATSLYI